MRIWKSIYSTMKTVMDYILKCEWEILIVKLVNNERMRLYKCFRFQINWDKVLYFHVRVNLKKRFK
jgi:hypothetical protein